MALLTQIAAHLKGQGKGKRQVLPGRREWGIDRFRRTACVRTYIHVPHDHTTEKN